MSRTHGDTLEIQRRIEHPERYATPAAPRVPVAPSGATVIPNAPALPVEAAPVPPEDKPATLAQIEALARTLGIGSLAPQGSAEPPLTTDTAMTGATGKTWLIIGAGGIAVIAITFFLLRK
jgi:hypothetical protein